VQRTSLPGIILIVLGVIFIAGQRLGIGGEGVTAAIGLAFVAAFAFTRNYGFLVPGGIMTGLGLGIVYQTRTDGNGTPVMLGLGLGFASIYALDAVNRRTAWGWWPLIPGGVLTLVGLVKASSSQGWLSVVGQWWPVALIVVGGYLLLRPRLGAPKP
jgi:hypothetical protein